MLHPASRVATIDIMRGLVIVLMALDHTRDYFSSAMFSPTDLNRTNAAYFFTRWLTHLCAPTFVFLAGASAYLTALRRTLSPSQLSAYLLRRGLMLVLLELTVIRFGWNFNFDYRYSIAQVIWVLGWSMTTLALLIRFPRSLIAAISVAAIAGHNLLDHIRPGLFGSLDWLWTLLHEPGIVSLDSSHALYGFYPLIPWFAVMSLGYCCGPLFTAAERQLKFIGTGVLLTGCFIILRMLNGYGDPQPWQPQKTGLLTLLSFLNVEKYPPSLQYLSIMLGLMFLLLALFETTRLTHFSRCLLIFGRTPLFFYIAHIYVIHAAALAIAGTRGLPLDWLWEGSINHPFPSPPAPDFGFSLPVVYGLWLLVLAILYPFCLKLAR